MTLSDRGCSLDLGVALESPAAIGLDHASNPEALLAFGLQPEDMSCTWLHVLEPYQPQLGVSAMRYELRTARERALRCAAECNTGLGLTVRTAGERRPRQRDQNHREQYKRPSFHVSKNTRIRNALLALAA